MTEMIDRRKLLFGLTSLIACAHQRAALAGGRGGAAEVRRLLGEAHALGESLSGAAWQEAIEKLLIGADVQSIAQVIDMDALLKDAPRVERGARVVTIPKQPWLKARPGGQVKLFAFETGRANPPHAHDRMGSIHLVLRGRFRVRHFERVRDGADHIAVRPTIDRQLGPAEATSISDDRDNVHWHYALEPAVLLDVVSATKNTRTHLIDPERARRDGDLWLAPRIDSVEEALRRYG